ncbi:hypothetical protein F4803DRAFT_517116 [Xylaria telfairii]|nr:hypothetical protein F4803DRAFT_517116 [Xylaria telfairii]
MLQHMAASLLAVALLWRRVSAAPVTTLEADILAANGNINTLTTELAPSWLTTSPVRSTAGILWTAVTTLSLCVYTVIHLNVPPQDEKRWKFYRRKASWVLAVILAPEYALWAAWVQWDAARHLHNKLQKYQLAKKNETDLTEQSGRKQREEEMDFGWTYCFFVVMGGLTVNVGDIQRNWHEPSIRSLFFSMPCDSNVELMTITPMGLCLLAECNSHLPQISKKSIKDRSKADNLAKLLVCVQVSWLIIQSIGRAAKGLPIALLEIHVLAHVGCALLLYGLWFKKPLDVYEATIVDSSRFDDELAFMLLISQAGDMSLKEWRNAYNEDNGITARNWLKILRGGYGLMTETPEPIKGAERAAEKLLEVWKRNDPGSDPSPLFDDSDSKPLVYQAHDVRLGTLLDQFRLISPYSGQLFPAKSSSHFFISRAMVCLTAVYAAIHLSAWRYHFPTETEMWLWRASSLTIAGVLPTTLFLLTIILWISRRDISDPPMVLAVCSVSGLSLLVLVYVAARFFLFIEAFISVRQMPIGVFVTMQWSDYIPHI